MKKEALINTTSILVGNLLIALAVTCFIVPNEILSGGVAGISIALHPLLPFIDITLLINIITITLFVVGSIFLGKGFFFKTLLSTISYALFLNVLTLILNGKLFTDNLMLANIYSGIFVGSGLGIIFRTGASTGGLDIPALLMEKYLQIPVNKACLIVDGLTVLLGITTHSLEAAMFGLISVFVSTKMIDFAISFGGLKTKSVMIISDHYEEILHCIQEKLDRGTTLLHAEGGYSREGKEVVLVVIDNRQYPKLNALVSEIDDNAFMIVQDAHEVKGKGFTILS